MSDKHPGPRGAETMHDPGPTHDPLCPVPRQLPEEDQLPCLCYLIAKARADEREARDDYWAMVRTETLADLHAKVEALPAAASVVSGNRVVYRADVLALIDGDTP